MANKFDKILDDYREDDSTTSLAWGSITGTLSNQTDLQSALNAKEASITAGTALQYWRGDKTFQTLNTLVVPESTNLYFTNARAIAATLTGYVSGAGTVSASDSILQAIQKLNGNTAALVTGVSSVNALTGAVALTGTANRITISVANVFDISASYVGQSSITTLGTITTGVWNGTAIIGTYGGTGVNNGTKTFTYLKNISFTAADDAGVYTLPTGTKTLVATDVATLSSLASIGTITTGVWNSSTKIGLAYGGTNADLSGTGGTSQVLKQNSAGAAITVAQLAASDLSNGITGSGAVVLAGTPTLTTAVLGSSTATTQTPGDNSTKVATTAYVDAAVLGQNFKEACKVATTANLVGAYLAGVFTYTATGTDSIDGVTLALNDRVLVKNQTDNTQNGIYKVTTAGAIGIAGVLTRATDANTSFEFKTGDSVFITAGTTQTSTTWAYTGVDSPTIGTDAITYVQVAGQGSFTAGNGITITGVSIAIDTSVTVDKTTAQSLTNKTITSSTNVLGGVTMTLGSDATNDMYYRNSSGVLTRFASANNGVLITSGTGVPSISSTIPTATQDNITRLGTIVSIGAALGPAFGGTGVANNSAMTVTGSGNFGYTRTLTGTTNVTFPTSGTLATLAGSESLTNKKLGSLTTNGYVKTSAGDGTLSVQAVPIPIADGGTNSIAALSNSRVMTSVGGANVESGSITDGDGIQRNNTTFVTAPLRILPEGRLTLTSATPVTTSDVTAATTVYYALYVGDSILLYDGTRWKVQTFTEQSIKTTDSQTGTTTNGNKIISGLTDTSQLIRGMQVTGTNVGASAVISTIDSATQVTVSVNSTGSASNTMTFKLVTATPYDIFYVQSSGKLQFSNAWTSATARNDALGTQNGIQVNNAAINSADSNTIAAKTGLYLGTIYTSAAGQVEDSLLRRYVWNNYNRVSKELIAKETTSSWNYTTAAWRQSNANTANKVEMVIGLSTESIDVTTVSGSQSTSTPAGGVGIDSTTAASGIWGVGTGGVAGVIGGFSGRYVGWPGIGYHYAAWIEFGNTAATFYGHDTGANKIWDFGLTGYIWA